MERLIEIAMRYFFSFILFFTYLIKTNAQDYQAVQGSSFAGSLGLGDNPASIVNTPFPWDIDIFSLQLKSATNAFTIQDYSLLGSAKNTAVYGNGGDYNHYADLNFNINLLNARIALNRKQAVGFGVNLRGYGHLSTGAYNYNDTINSISQFFGINDPSNMYSGHFTGSSWLEAFLTYSQTLWESDQGRLNGGITLKAMRGMAGSYAQVQNGRFSYNNNPAAPVYTVNTAEASYGYSYNFDSWQQSRSTLVNLKNFVENARGGFSGDIGLEYLVRPQGIKTYFSDDDYFDYEWKFGVALLDLGHNQYRYGDKSHLFASPVSNLTDSVLDKKFDSVSSFQGLNDSLAMVVNGFSNLNGKFKVQNPTRLTFNADHPFGNDFYINVSLSLNLGSLFSTYKTYGVPSLNLIACTPRWETMIWGVYLPIQYNMEKQLWVGGAFKAGPLLLGIHNWASVFSKNKTQDGGGYLAIVIHPSSLTKASVDKRLDCPKN